VAQAGLRAVVLRLAAIYGPALSPNHPARGVRQRLRAKQYKLWDGGRYYFSRIMVDDLVRIIRACGERAPVGATYVVGDDHPCPQGEYGRWLASHLGLPEPPVADSHQSRSASNAIRGRRLRNARLKRELGIDLLYPSYMEGEKYLDACEQGVPLPSLSLSQKSAGDSLAAAPEPPPSPPPWPRAAAGEDLGRSAGLAPVGAVVVALLPGQRSEPGSLYLVLHGQPSAQWNGRRETLVPQALVPPGAAVQNDTQETVLLLRLGPAPPAGAPAP
jgi:hypothetical protein